VSATLLAPLLSILHNCVPQHAMQTCVSTPMAALTTRIRRWGTRPDFPPETEVAAPEPMAPYPRRPPQAILPSLKSHSLITASVAPATYSKRPYRNRPGWEKCAESRLNHRGGPDRVLTFFGTDPENRDSNPAGLGPWFQMFLKARDPGVAVFCD